jgi:hypothetical protein
MGDPIRATEANAKGLAIPDIVSGLVNRIEMDRFGVKAMPLAIALNRLDQSHYFCKVIPDEYFQVGQAVNYADNQHSPELDTCPSRQSLFDTRVI